MKKVSEFIASRLLTGVLVVTPIYLAILLLLKAAQSLSNLLKPIM